MQVGQRAATHHPVEGQRASRTVHIHRHPVGGAARGGGQGQDGGHYLVVAGIVAHVRAVQAPRAAVLAKQAVVTFALAAHIILTHRHKASATPLHLPVAPPGQSIAAQQLAPVEALRPIWIWLLLPHVPHGTAVIRETDVGVDRVHVHSQSAGI